MIIKKNCIYKDYTTGVIDVITFFANSEFKFTNELTPLIKRFPIIKSKSDKKGLIAKNFTVKTEYGDLIGMITKKKTDSKFNEEEKENFRKCFKSILTREQIVNKNIGIICNFDKDELKLFKRLVESVIEEVRFEGSVACYI